jgi:hypothetical protein
MHEKDYVRIGIALRNRANLWQGGEMRNALHHIVNDLVVVFKEDNKKFDEKKFREFVFGRLEEDFPPMVCSLCERPITSKVYKTPFGDLCEKCWYGC